MLALLTFWMVRPVGEKMSDEQRYREMLHREARISLLISAEKRLPGTLVRLLRIENLQRSYIDKDQAQENALLASGYLAKTSITITNLPLAATNDRLRRVEIRRRLQTGLRGVVFWSFYLESSNQTAVICRASDLDPVRRALETP